MWLIISLYTNASNYLEIIGVNQSLENDWKLGFSPKVLIIWNFSFQISDMINVRMIFPSQTKAVWGACWFLNDRGPPPGRRLSTLGCCALSGVSRWAQGLQGMEAGGDIKNCFTVNNGLKAELEKVQSGDQMESAACVLIKLYWHAATRFSRVWSVCFHAAAAELSGCSRDFSAQFADPCPEGSFL